ncbi:MAG: hypothetical protein GWN01_08995 [Nitrosopumilaceae archaeon]|nr:hypothetical protein [Nitrosopumilaceae archaeon]NIU01045.1 hypothetical protein [Nitrosopumilaceae archaeon]NIU87479.1 hypothetical protein [Nitrosopumilaceae archaeon]NIV65529.1 hypothetical protein [Nitrosopumilaceae archaeon]NIX61647.1 hypothetical protein [Nitrosopumilaceae archaeon]
MSQQHVLEIAKESMKENKKLLNALGSEENVKIIRHPEEDTVSKLMALLPKSDLGKAALIGAAALIAYELLKSKE